MSCDHIFHVYFSLLHDEGITRELELYSLFYLFCDVYEVFGQGRVHLYRLKAIVVTVYHISISYSLKCCTATIVVQNL